MDACIVSFSEVFPVKKMYRTLPMVSRSPLGRCKSRKRRANSPLQHSYELLNGRFFLFGQLSPTAKESGIQLGSEQSILESLDHPVDHRDHHLDVEIVAQFSPLHTKTHEADRAVWIFADEKAVDLALEHEIGTVVAE